MRWRCQWGERICLVGGRKKKFAEDEDFDDSEEGSEMSDSEFEDPDEMEVPMGGKNLLGASSVKAPKDEDASDDDIKVISDNGSSNGKAPQFGAYPGRLGGAGMNISPLMANQGLLKTKAGEDPGFEIIKEVPGNSGGMPRMMGGLMGGLMGPASMQGMFKDAGLGNPNMMKYTMEWMQALENGGNPFNMLGGMGG